MSVVISGASARLYINGQPVGFATNVTVTQSLQNARVDVLNNVLSEEIETVGISVTVTADMVKMRQKALSQAGVWPVAIGTGATVAVINFPYLDMELYNEVQDEPIYRVTRCKPANRTVTVGARDIMTTNASFDAIGFDDNPSA